MLVEFEENRMVQTNKEKKRDFFTIFDKELTQFWKKFL